jgi:hypothetical protein
LRFLILTENNHYSEDKSQKEATSKQEATITPSPRPSDSISVQEERRILKEENRKLELEEQAILERKSISESENKRR